jgi:hypothetical protein
MIPYELYKVLHIIGILLVVASLSAMCVHMMNGGTKAYANKRFIAMAHGLGLLLTLVAGFGLLARLGLVHGLPLWAICKLGIWLILGGLPALIYRKPALAKAFWFSIFLFAGTAATLAIYKPF